MPKENCKYSHTLHSEAKTRNPFRRPVKISRQNSRIRSLFYGIARTGEKQSKNNTNELIAHHIHPFVSFTTTTTEKPSIVVVLFLSLHSHVLALINCVHQTKNSVFIVRAAYNRLLHFIIRCCPYWCYWNFTGDNGIPRSPEND